VRIFSFSAALTVLLLSTSLPLRAQVYSTTTNALRLLYFEQSHRYVVPHVVASFENAMNFHHKLFDYVPTEQVTMLLHDVNDYGTGGTSTIPWNFLSIGLEPFDYVYETSPTNERFNWVMNHELMHLVATDKAAGTDRFFRSLFGGKVTPTSDQPMTMMYSFLTTPRWYCPRWYQEGIAVFMETWMAGGIGRVLGGYDEMVFRTMVRDGSYFYDYVGLESEGTTIDFQIGANSYLYGTRFVSYLANTYGPETLLRWYNRTDDSRQSYSAQFEDVYGRSISDAWSQWVAWEHEWQRANLDSLRRYSITPYRPLVSSALGSASRAFYDSASGKLYVALNLPGQLPQIAAIDRYSGEMKKICIVTGPALYYVCSTAFDPSSGDLFFTTHNGSGWRDIQKVNIRTGDVSMIFSGARTGDLAFNTADRSLWGIRHHDGYSTLVRSPFPYDRLEIVFPFKYGRDLFDPDISPDGTYLSASMIDVSGRQQLVRMRVDSLVAGSSRFEVLYEFKDNSPENFVFSPDGRYLYGTTYLTGTSNVVRYDLERREMKWVTNTETGFFRPLPISRDSLVVYRYTGSGFLPVMIADTTREDVAAINYLGQSIVDHYPVVTTWKAPPPSVINADSVITGSGDYNGWSHLRLASVYPVLEGYKVYTAIGVRANIQDPLPATSLTIAAAYTPQPGVPENERMHGHIEMDVWQWKFSAAYNGADFYDLFGPTKSSRKGYSAGVRYSDYLVYDRPKTLEYTIAVNGYTGLERLPFFQNILATYDRFATVGGKLSYSNVRRSLGAVDAEHGLSASISNTYTIVQSSVFPKVHATMDVGLLLPIDHSSVWLRTATGYAFGDRATTFAYYYFGGFGNNWVDNGEVRRYRQYYSFPGVELDAIGGSDFGKALLEWTIPPVRFRQFGIPTLYCTWAQLALFSSGIVTDIGYRETRTFVWNVGAQVDFKLVLFWHLNSTFSFGYALAAEQYQRPTREFMFSLKLL
jgi:hypothetical protein